MLNNNVVKTIETNMVDYLNAWVSNGDDFMIQCEKHHPGRFDHNTTWETVTIEYQDALQYLRDDYTVSVFAIVYDRPVFIRQFSTRYIDPNATY